jgi:hypothetical protein
MGSAHQALERRVNVRMQGKVRDEDEPGSTRAMDVQLLKDTGLA